MLVVISFLVAWIELVTGAFPPALAQAPNSAPALPAPKEQRSVFLVGVSRISDGYELKYGPADPSPFVLTVTRQYVANKTLQPLPATSQLDVTDYINRHVNELRTVAEQSRASGRASEVLK
jgi:hypothetical protein